MEQRFPKKWCGEVGFFSAGDRSRATGRQRASDLSGAANQVFPQQLPPTRTPDDQRIAMNWSELRSLRAHGHVVGCHSRTHIRLTAEIPLEQLDDEIITAKRDMEARLGETVDCFCWVGGEEWSYSSEAAKRIRTAGYEYSFMTCSEPCIRGTNPLQLQRTNVESAWPMHIVRLQLCGLPDRAHAAKRRRAVALTAR